MDILYYVNRAFNLYLYVRRVVARTVQTVRLKFDLIFCVDHPEVKRWSDTEFRADVPVIPPRVEQDFDLFHHDDHGYVELHPQLPLPHLDGRNAGDDARLEVPMSLDIGLDLFSVVQNRGSRTWFTVRWQLDNATCLTQATGRAAYIGHWTPFLSLSRDVGGVKAIWKWLGTSTVSCFDLLKSVSA